MCHHCKDQSSIPRQDWIYSGSFSATYLHCLLIMFTFMYLSAVQNMTRFILFGLMLKQPTAREIGLVYSVSCHLCSAIYICKTGRKLRQCFSKHLQSVEMVVFSVLSILTQLHGHSTNNTFVRGIMLCKENARGKHLEICLIFKFGNRHLHGLNN